jgi:hypothetical protein
MGHLEDARYSRRKKLHHRRRCWVIEEVFLCPIYVFLGYLYLCRPHAHVCYFSWQPTYELTEFAEVGRREAGFKIRTVS